MYCSSDDSEIIIGWRSRSASMKPNRTASRHPLDLAVRSRGGDSRRTHYPGASRRRYRRSAGIAFCTCSNWYRRSTRSGPGRNRTAGQKSGSVEASPLRTAGRVPTPAHPEGHREQHASRAGLFNVSQPPLRFTPTPTCGDVTSAESVSLLKAITSGLCTTSQAFARSPVAPELPRAALPSNAEKNARLTGGWECSRRVPPRLEVEFLCFGY